MKSFSAIILLGLIALGAAQTAETTKEPEPTPDPTFQCPANGYYPYEGDCTKFYDCTNGLAWVLQCDAGLYFNFETRLCDWPENVDCDYNVAYFRNVVIKGQEIIGPAENYTCEANGAFPHEELCEYFYDCYEGVAFLGRCTEGFLFDLTYFGCNFPNQTDCGDRIRPPGTTNPPSTTPKPTTPKSTTTTPDGWTGPTPTTPEDVEFTCPSADGFFRDPTDCNAFFQCVNFVAYRNHCPEELVWNEAIDACDFPFNVPECS